MLAFALLLLAAAAAMLVRGVNPVAQSGDPSPTRVASVGIATGVLTGFLGVGGGFVIVPALVLLLGLPPTLAVGTSLLVIPLTSATALAAHLSTGSVDWRIAVTFAVGAIAGTLAGRRASVYIKPARVSQLFALLLVTVAVFVVVEVATA